MPTLEDATWRQLLLDARTHNGWVDKPVDDAPLRRLYELARMGPTAMNCQPVRLVFVKSHEAKERLRQLLASGTPRLAKVPCACPPGTEGTSACNHGRSCGVLSVDGTDVAQTLIGEGLAVAFHCGSTGCPPLPRPWCD